MAIIQPKLNNSKELSYIIGTILGDGWVTKHNYNYVIGLSVTNKVFADEFSKALRVIGLNPNTTIERLNKKNINWKDRYVVRANSKVFFEWYKKLGMKDIEKISKKYKPEFIRGFYDSDGSLQHRTINSWRVALYNSNRELIHFVKRTLESLGFKLSLYSSQRDIRQREYNLTLLGGTEEAKKFMEIIQPTIKII